MKILKKGFDQVPTKKELVGCVVYCEWCGCRFKIEKRDLPKIKLVGFLKEVFEIRCPNCQTILGVR